MNNKDNSLPSKNKALQDTRTRLDDMMMEMKDVTFTPQDHLLVNNDMPEPPAKEKKDYTAIKEIALNKAKAVIKTIASNYVFDESLLDEDKSSVIVEEQASKLADLAYLIDECKEMAMSIKDMIDGGDIHPDTYKLHRGYQTDVKTYLDAKSSHLTTVENYWKALSEKAGLKESKDELQIAEKQTTIVKSENETTKENSMVMTSKQMNEMLQKTMDDMKQSREQG